MLETIHSSSKDAQEVARLGLTQPLTSIDLKAPQLLAYDWMVKQRGGVLSLDKGMGKTITYLAAALAGEPENVVITTPTNGMIAQRREILAHFPQYAEDFVFVRGQAHQRAKAWSSNKRIFICTPATLQTDLGLRARSSGNVIVPPWITSNNHFDAILFDEFHKVLRNRTSGMYKLMKRLKPQFQVYASGSAFNKGPQDIWAVLNILDPKVWSSYWRLVNTYCEVEQSHWGKNITGVKNIERFRMATAPYLFHRKKDPADYPPKERFFFDVEMEPWQKNLHDKLVKELMYFDEEGDTPVAIVAQNAMEKIIRARMALICPKALDPSFGVGAGLEAIVDDYKTSELSHAIISTPFRICVPHITQHLNSVGIDTYVLQGGISPEEQEYRINTWTQRGGIIVQTIKYATSYELLAAQNMYFLGQEYSAEDNKQAEDRPHRLSSTKPLNIWYVRHLGTYEEEIIARMLSNAQNIWSLLDKPLEVAKLMSRAG